MRVEVDADFAAWAGARQRPFLRAAYVIRGDRREAERVVIHVLEAVAPRWERLRQDDPDAEARRLLYQEAVGGEHTGRTGTWAASDPAPDRWRGVEPDVAKALERLTARQRAVLFLQCLDGRTVRESATVLGVGVHAVESQTAGALVVVREALPALTGLPGVAELLDGVADELPDIDLADRAWDRAAQRGLRRRRSVVATTVAVVGLGAIATVASSGRSLVDSGPRPSPAVTPKPSTVPPTTQVATDGTVLLLGRSDGLASLPVSKAGIPGDIDWDPRSAPQSLASLVAVHAGASGRAALRILYAVLSPRAVDAWVPVMLVRDDRDGSLNYASVDGDLGPLGSAFGSPDAPLTARAIDPTGTKAVFLQPRGVTLVDVTTGTARVAPLPARPGAPAGPLIDGGFTDSGRIVVRAPLAAWTLDPTTLVWTRMADGSSPEVSRVESGAQGSRAVTLAPDGSPAAAIERHLPVLQGWGQTVVTDDWLATGGVIDPAAVPARFRLDNALFLVSRKDPTLRRAVLLSADAQGATTGGIRTVGVAGRVVLFQYSTAGRTWVLGLDPGTGLLSRVAEAWSPVAGVGSASQVVAISPWAIAHRANLAQGRA